jgi:hypothetical protein
VDEGLVAAGGARGSNGSRALQASLARCLRIRSTTRGTVFSYCTSKNAPCMIIVARIK